MTPYHSLLDTEVGYKPQKCQVWHWKRVKQPPIKDIQLGDLSQGVHGDIVGLYWFTVSLYSSCCLSGLIVIYVYVYIYIYICIDTHIYTHYYHNIDHHDISTCLWWIIYPLHLFSLEITLKCTISGGWFGSVSSQSPKAHPEVLAVGSRDFPGARWDRTLDNL